MSEPEIRSATVIGLGLMGAALARALIDAGHRVTVWNRTATKAAPLGEAGARIAGTIEDAVEASDLMIVCVTDQAATLQALGGLRSVPGKTLVQLSTMDPDESAMLQAWARERGIDYLDGSIVGLPSTVGSRQAMLIFSGPARLYERHAEVLAACGRTIHLGDDVGLAQKFDRVWYAYVYGQILAFLQGAAMAEAFGFSLDAYLEFYRARAPVVADRTLAMGRKVARRDWSTEDATIDIWINGFKATAPLCREHGVDDRLPSLVLDVLEDARAAGHGGNDLAAVADVLRTAAPSR